MMIDIEILESAMASSFDAASRQRQLVIMAKLFNMIENSPEFMMSILKDDEVAKQYQALVSICETESARISANEKYNTFLNSLSDKERNIIEGYHYKAK